MTPQRQAVVDVLQRAVSHPDPAWVHEEVRKVIPNITIVTVERTLRLLRQAGLIREMVDDNTLHEGDAGSRPEASGADGQGNCHASCLRCHRVVDIGADACEDLIADLAYTTGFVITGHRLHLYGLCPGCALEGHQRN